VNLSRLLPLFLCFASLWAEPETSLKLVWSDEFNDKEIDKKKWNFSDGVRIVDGQIFVGDPSRLKADVLAWFQRPYPRQVQLQGRLHRGLHHVRARPAATATVSASATRTTVACRRRWRYGDGGGNTRQPGALRPERRARPRP
jgi:beta-glucanase (GH16 family)